MSKSKQRRQVFLNGAIMPRRNWPSNQISNTKYNIITFVPVVLFNQFKFFFNLFFLLIAISQFFQILRVGKIWIPILVYLIGFLFTFLAPICFVLLITMVKEGWDDVQRYKRDKELNEQKFNILSPNGTKQVMCKQLKVGDILELSKNRRVPADCILLRTSEKQGTVFLRTDQLDGETDWKPRDAVRFIQQQPLNNEQQLLQWNASVEAQPPNKEIYKFQGTFQYADVLDRRQSIMNSPQAGHSQYQQFLDQKEQQFTPENSFGRKQSIGSRFVKAQGLVLNNTLWANTIMASSATIWALVIYTGKHTRSQMNSKQPRSKVGLVDNQINTLSKILFVLMVILSFIIVGLDNFAGDWYIDIFRFVLLLSSIIPISLRVNLDMAKIWYCWLIGRDKQIPQTIARNSTIPQQLGRIEVLLTDKTGTLTQNQMTLKMLQNQFGTYEAVEHKDLIQEYLANQYHQNQEPLNLQEIEQRQGRKLKNPEKQQLFCRELMTALSLCHNVTPVYQQSDNSKSFQASSPDQIALVNFAESIGMHLVNRQNNRIIIKNVIGQAESYIIHADFPFSSETKRMGILLQHENSGKVIYYAKGAETVMQGLLKVKYGAPMIGACDRFSNEGLRTLVIASRYISHDFFSAWIVKYKNATASRHNREIAVSIVRQQLECEMEMLGVTGVEDKLQEGVRGCIQKMRGAGIKVWMLTGDKVETATCIAISAGIKGDNQIQQMRETRDNQIERSLIEFKKFAAKSVLVVDGKTMTRCLQTHRELFFDAVIESPAVICCRCSPTQKSEVVKSIKQFTKKRTCAIGDGGNDVAMIQQADVGIGIVGKQGKQASLSADFSINQFSYIKQLILWHGRLSYTRTAVLSQFVIHRGLIISAIQAVFSILFYFAAIPIYNGMLMLGYTTIYTSLPVFSLVFDQEANVNLVMDFSNLYLDLQKGRKLSFKTFMVWVAKSIYQGSMIIILTILIFNESFITNIVTVSFTSLIFIELLNIITTVKKIKCKIVASVLLSLICYIISILLFKDYINTSAITGIFILKVIAITAATWLPPFILIKIADCIYPDPLKKMENK